jgi:hypothetical protein
VLSIDNAGVTERAAVASLRLLDKATRAEIRKQVRPLIVDPARREASRRARTTLAGRVAVTGRASWWRDVPGVAWGGTRPVTHDGTRARDVAHGTEYGSRGDRFQRVSTRSPRGTAYVATRRQTAAFRPRDEDGAYLAPAALAVAPAVIDAWSLIVVDATAHALDGGR